MGCQDILHHLVPADGIELGKGRTMTRRFRSGATVSYEEHR